MRLRIGYASTAIVVAAAAVAAALAASASAPEPEPTSHSAWQHGDHSASSWRASVEARGYDVMAVVSGLETLTQDSPRGDLLVRIEPGAPTAEEANALDRWLAGGGSLWVATNSSAQNAWLLAHGIAVGTRTILAPTAAATVPVAGTSPETGTHGLELKRPGSLLISNQTRWQVWQAASDSTFLDLDQDGAIGQTDLPGPHPTMAAARTPAGAFLAVSSDSSAFTARVVAGSEAADFFASTIGTMLGPTGRVIVDETQHGWTQSEAIPVHTVNRANGLRGFPEAGGAILIAAAGLAGLAGHTSPAVRPFMDHVPRDPESVPAGPPRSSFSKPQPIKPNRDPTP